MNTKEIKLEWVNGQIEKRFSNTDEYTKQCAEEIAKLIIDLKNDEAKKSFEFFVKDNKMVFWEKIAFSDYVSLIKQKIELECPQ